MKISKKKIQLQLAKECISNGEAAARVGVSVNRFLAIIRSSSITPKTAGRVARALNCDITEILADDQTGEA